MDSFVAFLDILGTRERVGSGEFSALDTLDFANPAGMVASRNPQIRVAVFSDSVILSCDKSELHPFVSALSYLYSSWTSDFVLVRGGVSLGEIVWTDDTITDRFFRTLPNLSCARVYGKGLIAAHSIEQRSGPGAICFLDETAAIELSEANLNYVLPGGTDALVWTDKIGVTNWTEVFKRYCEDGNLGCEERRHLRATFDYFRRLQESGKALPEFPYRAAMNG